MPDYVVDENTGEIRFADLYKKSSKGKLQKWSIRVQGNKIITEYGIVGGQMQSTEDIVKSGKNANKINETTPERQAFLEAQSKWEKKLKKGYMPDTDSAMEGKTVHAGGVDPMLAHNFDEHGHKITYPAAVQPKLDGIRCIAVIKNGKSELWTRSRKPILSMPHICEELNRIFDSGEWVLDGELYNHDLRHSFEKIASIVRKESPDPEHRIVQYHVYDMICDGGFEYRFGVLRDKLTKSKPEYILPVLTQYAKDRQDVLDKQAYFVMYGYEGAMVRNLNAPYEHTRSYNLQKVKNFLEGEFEIVEVLEGRGKLMGHAGSFTCKTNSGATFNVKMEGPLEQLKEIWDNKERYIGKLLTVKYQTITEANGVPRFPVGKSIRDYE